MARGYLASTCIIFLNFFMIWETISPILTGSVGQNANDCLCILKSG